MGRFTCRRKTASSWRRDEDLNLFGIVGAMVRCDKGEEP
jgi:hypothetical protein